MMQAMISGQAGLAVLIDGDSVCSITAEEPDVSTSRNPSDLLQLFAGAADVAEINVASRDEAVEKLRLSWNRDRALQMTLILLDRDEEPETRKLAAESVADRLDSDAVREWLLARLYQAPMPASGDLLPGAVDLTDRDDLRGVHHLLVDLQSDQPHIQTLSETWSELSVPKYVDKAEMYDRLISVGACYRLARAASVGDPGTVAQELRADPRIGPTSATRQVITSWIAPLRSPAPHMNESPGGNLKIFEADLTEHGLNVSEGLVDKIKDSRTGPAGAKKSAAQKRTRRKSAGHASASSGNMSDAIRNYMIANPGASRPEIRDALQAKGVPVSNSLVNAVFMREKKRGGSSAKPGPKASGGRKAASGRPASAPSGGSQQLSADELIDAKDIVDQFGGIDKVRAALSVLEQLQD